VGVIVGQEDARWGRRCDLQWEPYW
jgi:hypothetical protein